MWTISENKQWADLESRFDWLKRMKGVPQDARYHAEGDVAIHTQMVLEALKNETWMKDCRIWLYRGAWQEFETHEIEMAVPLSPQEVERKKFAIFKHQSQKDRAVFPGDDAREFWQRAEDRNRETAQAYDSLGLAEYEAMEAFVRYKF